MRGSRVGIALASLLLLTACGSATGSTDDRARGDATPLTQLTPIASPRTHEGPSTAVLPVADITPVATDPAQNLPATVSSQELTGPRQMQVTDTSRVLALDISGSLAATVVGLGFGDTLVGRDQSTTLPALADLPSVTSGGHAISSEAVLELAPTLVITDGSVGPRDVIEQLRDAGVTVVFVERTSSYAGASRLAHDVAAAYGAPQAGAELARQIRTQVATTKAEINRLAPKAATDRVRMIFLYVRGNSGVYYLFGKDSGVSDLVEGLGGVDVAAEQGWTSMRPMTDEAIMSANPDLILVMTHGLESAGGVDGLLADKQALALTKAGQQRRFVDMADGDVLSFGPRSADVLAALARAVYAPKDPA